MIFIKRWKLVSILLIVTTSQLHAQKNKQNSDHLKKYQSTIEKYQNDKYLDVFLDNIEKLSEKYCSESFINSIVNADQIKKEQMHAWYNKLLWEIPFQNYLPNFPLRVGIYTKDILKALIVGADWGLNWHMQQQLTILQSQSITAQLIQSSDDIIAMTKTLTQATVSKQTKFSEDQKNILNNLYKIAEHHIIPSYRSLFTSSRATTIGTSFAASQLIQAARNHYLIDKQEEQFSILNLFVSTNHKKTQQQPKQPTPIFSIIHEQFFMGLPINSGNTSTIQIIAHFFKTKGFIPNWFNNSLITLSKDLSLYILFIAWLNKYFITPMWKNYLVANLPKLCQILESYKIAQKKQDTNEQKEYAKQLLNFVQRGTSLSFTTWLNLKNRKIAEWECYYHAILSLPGWYKIVKFSYNIYREIYKKQPTQTALEQEV